MYVSFCLPLSVLDMSHAGKSCLPTWTREECWQCTETPGSECYGRLGCWEGVNILAQEQQPGQ